MKKAEVVHRIHETAKRKRGLLGMMVQERKVGEGVQSRQNVYGNAIIIPITLCANLRGRESMHEVQERLSHIDFCGRPTRGNQLTHA